MRGLQEEDCDYGILSVSALCVLYGIEWSLLLPSCLLPLLLFFPLPQLVKNCFPGIIRYVLQWTASGFCVVCIDNRGAYYRGKAFEAHLHKTMVRVCQQHDRSTSHTSVLVFEVSMSMHYTPHKAAKISSVPCNRVASNPPFIFWKNTGWPSSYVRIYHIVAI